MVSCTLVLLRSPYAGAPPPRGFLVLLQCLTKRPDTVGQPPSIEIGVPNMPSLNGSSPNVELPCNKINGLCVVVVLVATNACQQNQIVTDSEVKMGLKAKKLSQLPREKVLLEL